MLCSIIGGVIATEPTTKDRVPTVLRIAKNAGTAGLLTSVEQMPTWECALAATVSGLRGWCAPKDIEIAIDWVDQNLPLILSNIAKRLPS